MRTTLTLDDDLAEALNQAARHSGQSFRQVVNAAIRRGLASGAPQQDSGRAPFLVEPQACGLMPGIDPGRLNQLLDQIEIERFQTSTSRSEALR